ELNVHVAENAKRADDYVTFTVKPDLKKLGPKLGKKLNVLKKALGEVEGITIRNALVEKGEYTISLDGEPFPLTTDDVLVEVAAKPGYAAAESGRVVVVLATEITDSLKREGYAREIVHAIQGMRRDLDLAFDARIQLGVEVPSELKEVLSEHGEYIAHETLARELSRAAIATAAKSESIEVESFSVSISIAPVK
ncbi:isoleucine--tRNA ligase, partial [bacterium]|nr:isoleucine--tRNA ligase [bacterium]